MRALRGLQIAVHGGEELAESSRVLGSILVDLQVEGLAVGEDDVFEQLLLVTHSIDDLLICRTNGRLQANHIELQTLCLDHAGDEVREGALFPARQQDCEGVWRLHAQSNQVDNVLVPPSLPRCLLFLHLAFARRGEDVDIMPPAAGAEDFECLELSYRGAGPDLLVWEGTAED